MSKAAPMSLPPRQPAKGSAVSSVSDIERPVVPSHAPPPQQVPEKQPLPAHVRALGGTVAITIRMDVETYTTLKMFGAKTRQTNQQIGLQAIRDYIAQNGGNT